MCDGWIDDKQGNSSRTIGKPIDLLMNFKKRNLSHKFVFILFIDIVIMNCDDDDDDDKR